MFAPAGQLWTLDLIQWWGGWAEGKHVSSNIEPHVLTFLSGYYMGKINHHMLTLLSTLQHDTLMCYLLVLRPCPTPGLIRLLRSHRSTVAQLRTSAHYSGPGHAHTLPLSATLCIRLNPVITTLPRPPCCTVSSPCSVCIFYLVVFSPDLTYFHRT